MSTIVEEPDVLVGPPALEPPEEPPGATPSPTPNRPRPPRGGLAAAGLAAALILGVAFAAVPPGTPGHQLWVNVTGGAATSSQTAPGSPVPGPGTTSPGAGAPAPADPQTAAVELVIQRANNEQAQAIANGNPAVMQDTATPAHYQDLVQINQGLVAQGVTAIRLTNISWGPITVNGSSASATSYETWLTTFSDGTTMQSTDTNVYTLVQQGGSWIVQDDQQPTSASSTSGNGVGGRAARGAPGRATAPGAPGQSTAPSQPVPAQAPASTPSSSRNWAGYAANGGGSYTGVTGTWTVPQPTSTGATGIGATWVGIGGVSSNDLIQAGTQDIATASGQLQFQTWLEMLPAGSQQVPLAVAPGDSVTVSINEQGAVSGQWQIAFKNNTSGQSYQTTVQYRSLGSSAEWIEEAPATANGIVPLDSFGTVAFSGATAVRNGQTVNLTQAGAQPVTMRNASRQPLAVPSGIGGDGASFSVTRTAVSSTPSPAIGQQRGARGA